MPHLCGVSTPRSNQIDSRPPKGIAPRIGVGCQSFTLPSSANFDCYEGGNGVILQLTTSLYCSSRQSQNCYRLEGVEPYPKHDQLAGGPGSLIRMPFGVHRLTGRRCGFYTAGGSQEFLSQYVDLTPAQAFPEAISMSR
jgi:hypothetical protein